MDNWKLELAVGVRRMLLCIVFAVWVCLFDLRTVFTSVLASALGLGLRLLVEPFRQESWIQQPEAGTAEEHWNNEIEIILYNKEFIN